jgi:hypothetical protein
VELVVQLDAVGLADGQLSVPQALRIQSNGGSVTLSLAASILAPRLVLGTKLLDFGSAPLGQSLEMPLTLRNEGSAALTASLHVLAPWLSVSDAVVDCAPRDEVTVRVRADTHTFARGQSIDIPAAVRITMGATVLDVPARVTVLQPTLRVEPEQIDFGYIDRASAESQSLTIANDGNGALAWSAVTNAAWVELSATAGVCSGGGQSQEITVTAYGLALDSGAKSASASLVVNSDAGRAKVELHVGIAAPQLDVDTRTLELGPSINMKPVAGALRLFNRGLGQLTGSVSVDRAWLVPDRLSFVCGTGRSVEIQLTTDMGEFPEGPVGDVCGVHIASNGGDADVRVALDILAAPEVAVLENEVVMQRSGHDDGQPAGHLTLRNSGLATARVDLRANSAKLRLSRSTYEIKPGKSVRARIEHDALAPDAAPAEGEALYITVTSGAQTVRVPVSVAAADSKQT